MIRTLCFTRAAELVAFAAVSASAACFAVMHVTEAALVDPVASPVSSYALHPPGVVLFPLGTVSLALACVVLAGRGAGLPREGLIRFLLGATAVMLVGAAVFRTGTVESGLTFGAQVHRYSAGAAFVLLTVVAGLSAARMGGRGVPAAVRRATWVVTIVAALTFLVTAVNTFVPGLADGGQWRGIPQRVLLVDLSVLIWLLTAASARVRVPVSPRGARAEMVPARDVARAPALLASRP